MKIDVYVEEVDLTTVVYQDDGVTIRIGDLVADKAVAELVKSTAWNPLRERVLSVRDEQIREAVRPLIAQALAEPFTRTTEYGTPVGKPTTLREIIVEEAKRLLANAHSRSNSNYIDRDTVLSKLIRETTDQVVAAELRKVIDDEKAKVVAAVRAKAADLIAEAVRQGIGR